MVVPKARKEIPKLFYKRFRAAGTSCQTAQIKLQNQPKQYKKAPMRQMTWSEAKAKADEIMNELSARFQPQEIRLILRALSRNYQ